MGFRCGKEGTEGLGEKTGRLRRLERTVTRRREAAELQGVSLPRLGRVGNGAQCAGSLAPGLPCLMWVERH